jgi:predicted metal-dependent HD superfamily phosphohydrolase
MLESSWNRCWPALGASGDGHLLMHRLLAAYSEPQRKYHTIQHLSECLALFERYRALAAEPAEVEIALWFHDGVYNVRASDNERRSAEWAERELRRAGVATERVARVSEDIIATRHSALPVGRDQELVVDIDLAILGAPRARFDEYQAQIRAEYNWVPGVIFRAERRKVLSAFLARNPIYRTPALRGALEARARDNLAYAVRRLGGPAPSSGPPSPPPSSGPPSPPPRSIG